MEFLGTKDKWYYDKEANPFTVFHPSIVGEVLCTGTNAVQQVDENSYGLNQKYSETEAKANILLISKAPELLDMLNRLLEQAENEHFSEFFEVLKEEAELLLEESTKL